MNLKIIIKNNQSFVFIIVNIFVAFSGFIRSFAFMKFFDFKELGVITLVSTAAMLVGFFQLGLINGGYRIIALRVAKSNLKTNNVIFSYFTVLSIILAFISVLGFCLGFFTDGLMVLIFYVMSISMLITNWLTNTLIGGSEFKRLNIANSFSASASLFCLLLAYYFGLYGALLSLLIQPFLFIGIVFVTDKKQLPTAFDLDIRYIKYILNFGFIPFLSGIFFLVYQQIERWSITAFLGPEALGKMYLVFLTTTLWLLIPTSINNLFFPKAVRFFLDGNNGQLKKLINQYYLILILYCIIGSVLVLIVFPPLVNFIFPIHYPYINLVFILLPALILGNMCGPIVLLLNSMVKLKPILWSDIISTVSYGIMILVLGFIKIFSLENVLICYVIYNLIKFIYLLVNFGLIKRQQLI